jgi:hypothetical protein
MALRVRSGQREVNDRPSTSSGVVTIRKRRDGWQVIIHAGLDPLRGRQRQLTRQVNGSRRQAEKVEAGLRTEGADGQHAGTRVKTLGELVDLWIERRAASDKPISPDTVQDYRSLIAKKIKSALGSKRLHMVNARALDAFYDDLRRYLPSSSAAGWTRRRTCSLEHRMAGPPPARHHQQAVHGVGPSAWTRLHAVRAAALLATELGAVQRPGTVRERMAHGSLAVTSGYMTESAKPIGLPPTIWAP